MNTEQLETVLNNLSNTALVEIDRERQIIYIWEQDLKLLKPVPRIFLSKLIDSTSWQLRDKTYLPNNLEALLKRVKKLVSDCGAITDNSDEVYITCDPNKTELPLFYAWIKANKFSYSWLPNNKMRLYIMPFGKRI